RQARDADGHPERVDRAGTTSDHPPPERQKGGEFNKRQPQRKATIALSNRGIEQDRVAPERADHQSHAEQHTPYARPAERGAHRSGRSPERDDLQLNSSNAG